MIASMPRGGDGSARRGAALAANISLGLASAVLTLAVLEIAARVANERPGPPIPRLYVEHDPLLGWRHRPGARAEFPQGDYVINSQGLRDVERDETPPPGTKRILILGDSFAEGFSVPLEDCVSRVLERRLREAGQSVEVVNAGVTAYSTDQELLFYRTRGRRYGARIVILLFFFNDIMGNVADRMDHAAKPLFSCDEDTLHVTNTPLPSPGTLGPAHLHVPPPYPWHSAALEWLRKRLAALPRAYDAMARAGLWPRFEPRPPPRDLRVFARHPPPADEAAWRCTCRLLGALSGDVRDDGGRLLVAYVPSKIEVSERDWGMTRLEYRIHESQWDRGRVARDLAAAGAALGFPVLDLTPDLRRADSPLLGGSYHAHGGHWNALGHRVAAGSLFRFLREKEWLEGRG